MSAFSSEDSPGVELLSPSSNVIYGRTDWMESGEGCRLCILALVVLP